MKQLITETCPNCEKETTIAWDVKKDGYKTICPNCGKTLMLCSACLDSDTHCLSCDWNKENGCYRSREKPKQEPLVRNQLVKHNGNLYRVVEDQSDNSKETPIYLSGLSGFYRLVKLNEIKTFTKITKTARRYTIKAVKDFLCGDCDLGRNEQIVTLKLNNHRTLCIVNDYDNCSGVQLVYTPREFDKSYNNNILYEHDFDTDNFGSLFFAIQLALHVNEQTPLSE